ncbi:hypothetical protein KQS_05970 [Sporocytophaga myxococcoides]|uniref:Phage envelope protein n=1 Tax=Sporocytophaga myxococcoides TaxID=153721 RepID=A0A098LKY9_9BACT|nr:DUF1398 family protein [Sporocytophaga myxococcoides]GAL87666.1 hypothetical protein KQS_05970 [Sporocytophaga myxococcoides]
MFTIEQIKAAHSKVKSGADFPAYIQDIKSLGVTFYKTYVTDGHTDYYGPNDYKKSSISSHEAILINDQCETEQFKAALKAHQNGQSDYSTFITMSAKLGIEKWTVCMDKMTCTYFDKKGKAILVEEIPH